MDKFISNDIPAVLEKKEEARVANEKIKAFWNRSVSATEMQLVIKDKLQKLSEHTKIYLYNLLITGGHVGTDFENLRAFFMRDREILHFWANQQEEIDLYELFDGVDQECIDCGLITDGYTTVWAVDYQTGDI